MNSDILPQGGLLADYSWQLREAVVQVFIYNFAKTIKYCCSAFAFC
jgi:hypothetical protein